MNQNMCLALSVSRLTSIESDVGLDLHYETELLTYLYDVPRTYPVFEANHADHFHPHVPTVLVLVILIATSSIPGDIVPASR